MKQNWYCFWLYYFSLSYYQCKKHYSSSAVQILLFLRHGKVNFGLYTFLFLPCDPYSFLCWHLSLKTLGEKVKKKKEKRKKGRESNLKERQ